MTYSIEQFVVELRRGILAMVVLKMLETRHYGYSLKRALLDMEFEIEESTLYPLLRRLEKQGLINSEWEVAESRPRKYYLLNDEGRNVLIGLVKEYRHVNAVVSGILQR